MIGSSLIKQQFPVIVLVTFFASVHTLDPYYQSPQRLQMKPDFLIQKKVEESCDSSCYHNRNPAIGQQQNITFICGSDGFTYLNFEELNCVRMQCGKEIRIKQYGRCPRRMNLESPSIYPPQKALPPPPPPTTFPSNHLQQSPKPTASIDPNFLRFLSQQSNFQAPIRPLTFPEDVTVQVPKSSQNPQRLYSQPRPLSRKYKMCLPAECNCPDDDSFRPVCGSDSVTYGSECLLECNKDCKPDLVKYYDGYCGRLLQTRMTCPLSQCDCPEEEEYQDNGLELRKPICGSDGITYASLCLLECNKFCKPELKLSYAGYCGKISYPESI